MLFNANHVLGFFSNFNPDATENFTLYKGDMPAQYGGRVSSVLDVRMKEGNSQRIKVKGRQWHGLLARQSDLLL